MASFAAVTTFDRSFFARWTNPVGHSPSGRTTVWIELGCFSGGVGSSMLARKGSTRDREVSASSR